MSQLEELQLQHGVQELQDLVEGYQVLQGVDLLTIGQNEGKWNGEVHAEVFDQLND